VPFDPSQSYIPTTDFFDNRTIYATTQADLTIEKSSRLSINLGGDGFINKRHSEALASATGASARADAQYRVARNTTVGVNYTFNHYSFTNTIGGTDLHSLSGTYSVRPSRWFEFSAYAGILRLESKFIRELRIDPVIAQLLGIGDTTQIFHTMQYTPNLAARLSRRFRTGVLYVSGGHSVTPGNGLFLTSIATTAMGGYTFTGVRYWSFSVQGGTSRGNASGNISGRYDTTTAGVSISRSLGAGVHLTARYTARQYSSKDFEQYNRLIYTGAVGISFTPGDMPLRLW
jgi:hypothetical protein